MKGYIFILYLRIAELHVVQRAVHRFIKEKELLFHLKQGAIEFFQLSDAVVLVREDNLGLETFGFFGLHHSIGHDNHLVSREKFAGSCTVEADAARMAFARDDVGLDALAVAVVDHVNLLASHQSGSLHQFLVNRNATHIVQIGFGDGGAMDFRLEYM